MSSNINYNSFYYTLNELAGFVDAVQGQEGAFFVLNGNRLSIARGSVSDCPLSDTEVAKEMHKRLQSADVLYFSEIEFFANKEKILTYLESRPVEGKAGRTFNTHLINITSIFQKVIKSHPSGLRRSFAKAVEEIFVNPSPTLQDRTFLRLATRLVFLKRKRRALLLVRNQICENLELLLQQNPRIFFSPERNGYFLTHEALGKLDSEANQLYLHLIDVMHQENFSIRQFMGLHSEEIKQVLKGLVEEKTQPNREATSSFFAFLETLIWLDALKRNREESTQLISNQDEPEFNDINERFGQDPYFVFVKLTLPFPTFTDFNQRAQAGWNERIILIRHYHKRETIPHYNYHYEKMFQMALSFGDVEDQNQLSSPTEFVNLTVEKNMWAEFLQSCPEFETLRQLKKGAENEVLLERKKSELLKKAAIQAPKRKPKAHARKTPPPEEDERPAEKYQELQAKETPPPISSQAAPISPLKKAPLRPVEPPALNSPFRYSLKLTNWMSDPVEQQKSHQVKHPDIPPEKALFDHQVPIMLDVIADRFGHRIMFESKGISNPAIVLSCFVTSEGVYKHKTRSMMTYTFKSFRKEPTIELSNLLLYHRSLSQSIDLSSILCDYENEINQTGLLGNQRSSTTFNVDDLIGQKAVDDSYVESYDHQKQCLTISHPRHKAKFQVLLTDWVKNKWQ